METMIGRAKGMLLEPRATWKEIDTEFTKGGEIWGKYIIPLAAIGPLAATVGMILFGRRVPLTSLTTPVTITTAVSTGIAEMCFLHYPTDEIAHRTVLHAAQRGGLLFKRTAYNFVSLAHDEGTVDRTLEVLDAALQQI